MFVRVCACAYEDVVEDDERGRVDPKGADLQGYDGPGGRFSVGRVLSSLARQWSSCTCTTHRRTEGRGEIEVARKATVVVKDVMNMALAARVHTHCMRTPKGA